MVTQLCPSSLSIRNSPSISLQFPIICRPKMPSISIVLIVVIAAIGQQQLLHFVNADLPYAGSLYNCNETTIAADTNGTKWTYEFSCKVGDKCVDKVCLTCPPGVAQPDPVQCEPTQAVVRRCKAGFCDKNFDLNKYCGLAFTKKTDGKTYYFNCEGGGDCQDGGTCSDGSKPIITQCSKANLEVKGGKCRGTDEVCKDAECQKMEYQYQP